MWTSSRSGLNRWTRCLSGECSRSRSSSNTGIIEKGEGIAKDKGYRSQPETQTRKSKTSKISFTIWSRRNTPNWLIRMWMFKDCSKGNRNCRIRLTKCLACSSPVSHLPSTRKKRKSKGGRIKRMPRSRRACGTSLSILLKLADPLRIKRMKIKKGPLQIWLSHRRD